VGISLDHIGMNIDAWQRRESSRATPHESALTTLEHCVEEAGIFARKQARIGANKGAGWLP